MRRKLLGCCAFLLFGTFGMLTGVAQVHNNDARAYAPRISLEAYAIQSSDLNPNEENEPIGVCALDEAHPASDPAGYRECVEACKVGGKTLTVYRTRMPTPQFVAMCLAAAALGTVSCMGFCYSRFME